ncbi:uncharacterized protein LOC110852639 [Folsomia candida]|uniref:C2 domain-containing protein n=1 Tax=Folsomia candida TaxID=158441 RepID=A0A226E2X7_FOLCA|nr:uncharacterized protein LOC110852639 [Folsomia candida]OXA51789.1 hypothetical protein Fcan01_13490 [Folsomia candida]
MTRGFLSSPRRVLSVLALVSVTVYSTHASKDVEDKPAENDTSVIDVQFVISARELPTKKGILGQTNRPDSYVELEYFEKMTGGESKVYLTSTVPSTANPEWPDIVHVKFHNGQGQRIKFAVMEGSSDKEISHCSVSLKSIVNGTDNALEVELVGPSQKNGRLIINTLINKTPNDATVERLASTSKAKDIVIDLEKNPKDTRKSKKNKKNKKAAEDDED